MKAVQLLAALLVLTGAPAPARPAQTPAAAAAAPTAEQEAIMDRIEREVRLPEGADPLGAYLRYYALHQDGHGTRVVIGYYVRSTSPGRRWVDETEQPMIDDGGCSIVQVVYDLATQSIQNAYCNGVA
jgi:hypothetical protein